MKLLTDLSFSLDDALAAVEQVNVRAEVNAFVNKTHDVAGAG